MMHNWIGKSSAPPWRRSSESCRRRDLKQEEALLEFSQLTKRWIVPRKEKEAVSIEPRARVLKMRRGRTRFFPP